MLIVSTYKTPEIKVFKVDVEKVLCNSNVQSQTTVSVDAWEEGSFSGE